MKRAKSGSDMQKHTKNERPLEESGQGAIFSAQSLNPGKLHKFLQQLQTIQAKATQLEVERQAVALWASAVEVRLRSVTTWCHVSPPWKWVAAISYGSQVSP